MYTVTKSIDVDMAHRVRGHDGACVNLHGHTWKMEVELRTWKLNETGFVVDFGVLKRKVLQPVHRLLDHALLIGADDWALIGGPLHAIGAAVVPEDHDQRDDVKTGLDLPLQGLHKDGGMPEEIRPYYADGLKLALSTFTPTSERLARWLYYFSERALADNDRVSVQQASVYETLHPVQAVARYSA